jgi:16S rRNA (guanine(966)-N(2))-methyltransferase RsmD
MRILSGKCKGRTIKMPKGIRPTQDKVRKALFDILGDIEGLSFLELFAGSGAVGLEALSQGAKLVIFVEKNRQCCKIIEKNLSALRYHITGIGSQVKDVGRQTPTGRQRAMVLCLGALGAIPLLWSRQCKFDVVFLDPPYYKGISKKTLKTLLCYDIVMPSGLVICQHFKKDTLPDKLGRLNLFKQAGYADTILSFYKSA